VSASGQERLLKPWPGSLRRWSHAQGSAAEAWALGQGCIWWQGPMKKRERALWRGRRPEIGS
jgi:hypothetical protein